MTLEEYLRTGKNFYETGYETDGCTLIGWFTHRYYPELTPACHSHDYARRNLIKVEDQGENDNLFKEALKELGAPRPLRFIMYAFTKAQGFMQDKVNMGFPAFIGFVFFLLFVVVSFYFGAIKDAHSAEPYMLKIDYVAPTERESGQVLPPEEIAGYTVWHVDCKNPVKNTPKHDLLVNVRSYWFQSSTPTQCLIFVTNDTDGRLSVDSEVFVARDFRAPKPTTCKL